jgi:hypothetical protein
MRDLLARGGKKGFLGSEGSLVENYEEQFQKAGDRG